MAKLLQYGSQGNDVKTLQQNLNNQGYKLTADGIFGKNTLSAVKDFQKKNGLAVDGLVGDKTQKTLGSIGKAPEPKDDSNTFSYDPYKESYNVGQAKTALNTHLAQKPGEYESQWGTQLNDVMDKIMNREKFSYDVNGDALYQQYKDKYIQQGKMAMQDTMGQAAAMTGGYGNSYAASVGNQAYQASLQNLNDIIPELYQMAYDRYNQEGQDLLNQYSMLGDRENTDYGRYRDTVSDWNSDRGYLTDRYNNERAFDYGEYADNKSYAYNEYRNAIADEQWQDNFDESVRQFNETMAFNTANANVAKDTKTGTYTPKATSPSLSAKEYNDVLMNAETYATMGKAALDNYLRGMMSRGLSEGEANNIRQQYFPTYKIPEAKPQSKSGNTTYKSGVLEFMLN